MRRDNAHAGPSTMELKLRSDLDRVRRELAKLKKLGLAPAAPDGEALASSLQAAGLTDSRRHFARHYFAQVEEGRSRASRLRGVTETLVGLDDEAPEALPQKLAALICEWLGFGAAVVRIADPERGRLEVRGSGGRGGSGSAPAFGVAEVRQWLPEGTRSGRAMRVRGAIGGATPGA